MAEHRPDPSRVRDFPPELTLQENLPFDEIRRRLALCRVGSGLRHRAEAFFLRSVEKRNLHIRKGCRTVAQCAALHFGIGRREAYDLLRVGRALEELPMIDRALDEKQVCYSKVRELVRVARPETEAKWLDVAKKWTIDKVILAVRLAKPGEPPRDPDDRKGLPEVRMSVTVEVPPDVYSMWEQVQASVGDGTKRPVRDWECLHAAFQALLESGNGDGPAFAVTDRDGAAPAIETRDGLLPITPAFAELLASNSDERVPRPMRRKILARDGRRCRCCGLRRSLQLHHVQWRSRGGPTESWNLVTVCRMCHSLIHGDLIQLRVGAGEGKRAGAETDIRFEDPCGHDLKGDAERIGPLMEAMGDTLRRLVPSMNIGAPGGPSPVEPSTDRAQCARDLASRDPGDPRDPRDPQRPPGPTGAGLRDPGPDHGL